MGRVCGWDGVTRNAFMILVGDIIGKGPFERKRRRQFEVDSEDMMWMLLLPNSVLSRTLLLAVLNLWFVLVQ